MDKPRVLFGFRPEQVRDPECVVEVSEADIQEFAEMTVPVSGCGCGCGGSCGDEQELDDGAEDEDDEDVGEPAYKVTSGQIDSLIVWLKEFGHARDGNIKELQYEDELTTALDVLDDQWRHGKMTETQAEAFFEACGYL